LVYYPFLRYDESYSGNKEALPYLGNSSGSFATLAVD
jgi:hypothetical protein